MLGEEVVGKAPTVVVETPLVAVSGPQALTAAAARGVLERGCRIAPAGLPPGRAVGSHMGFATVLRYARHYLAA